MEVEICRPASEQFTLTFIKVDVGIFPAEYMNVCVSAGDKSALRPSGLRFGSPALTSRGLVQDDFKKVAEFIHRGNHKIIVATDVL